MAKLWWQTHRQLVRGSRGPDVERLQRALNTMGASPPLAPDGIFGEKTERAVREYQTMMRLVEDGKVGPVTHSVLFGGSYRYELARPPWVRQGNLHLCWAACLESVLRGAWPGRPHLSMADLQRRYSVHLNSLGGIDPPGLRHIGVDLRFHEILVGRHVRAEYILRALRSRQPLLLVDNSTGSIMHTRVVYGVHIVRGAIDLLLMDPIAGHVAVPIGTIQSLSRIGFLAPTGVGP